MMHLPAVLPLLLLAWTAWAVEFNRDIRPILSDRCFSCHGPDASKRQAGLRLDLEETAKAPLRGRRPIVPFHPEQSEILLRIESSDPARRMPPAYMGHAALPKAEIERLRAWIKEGAPWQNHWAFLSVRRPAIPEVRRQDWPRNPIDFFILARLEREGLAPAREADKVTLLRRVSLDLTGLPPTPEEADAFLNDPSPDAYEKVVDRLLASPRYAERMAIRWLEAARYADTNGYQSDGQRDMYRWRDWVLDAFHSNMPFDRFTIEQIAGDLLPEATLSQKIATGFHRNHRTNAEGGIVEEEFRVEYVADRVETTGTVWLGLTLGCARCHDHKYDPIPQREFYRLFAFFNNVPERGLVYNFGNEEPFIKAPTPEMEKKLRLLDERLAQAQRHWRELQPQIAAQQRQWEKKARKQRSLDWKPPGQVLHLDLEQGEPGIINQAARFDGRRIVEAGLDVCKFDYLDPFTFSAWIKPEAPDGAILSRAEDYFEGEGYTWFLKEGKLRLHITRRFTDISLRVETENPIAVGQWLHVAVSYDGYRKGAGVRMYVNGEPQKLNILFDELTYPFGPKEPFRVGAGAGEKYRFRGLIDDVRAWNYPLTPEQVSTLAVTSGIAELAAKKPERRSTAEEAKLRLCFLDRFAPAPIRQALAELHEAQTQRRKYFESIPTVMVMRESPVPRQTFVLRRGAYDQPGEKVTPGVPAVLPPFKPEWPANRLGLAYWLVDRANPLTARVTVNRFWQMLFGAGIVKTVEDFGSQGEWPMHPELLDWLAAEFMENGWNVKALLRTMVTSATYRQDSRLRPELLEKDPENRLLARGPRFRLPAEMIRDQALFASGLLVDRLGGPSVKPYQPPGLWQELAGGKGYQQDHGENLYRRSLYTYWKRTVAPPAMVTFDAPTRETCSVRETRTNTPLQALLLMNGVEYLEAARKLAERMIKEGGADEQARLERGFRLLLVRAPAVRERELLRGELARLRARFARDPQAAIQYLAQGESPRDPALDPVELAAYTGVASLLLNLDETVTKE